MSETTDPTPVPTPSQRPETPAAAGDDRPHKPADDREEVYFNGPPSAWASAASVFGLTLLGILFILAGAILRFFDFQPPWWVYLVTIIIGLFVLALPWLRLRSFRYRITNYRIDYERGLLWKKIDTMELWHVEDLTFEQSPLERIFGLGTICIVSHDPSTPDLDLRGIRKARPVFESLKQRIIAVKRQRGVIKMDVG